MQLGLALIPHGVAAALMVTGEVAVVLIEGVVDLVEAGVDMVVVEAVEAGIEGTKLKLPPDLVLLNRQKVFYPTLIGD